MKRQLKKVIDKQTIGLEEMTADFTPDQKKLVDQEMRYYYVLQALKKMRQELDLTQEELSVKARLPRTTITKIESGTYNPTIQTLMSVAAAMDKQLRVTLV